MLSSGKRLRRNPYGSTDRIQQCHMMHRLGQEVHGPSLHGLNRHRNVRVAADKNDRQFHVGLHEFGVKSEAGLPGEPHIEYQTFGR